MSPVYMVRVLYKSEQGVALNISDSIQREKLREREEKLEYDRSTFF